MSKQILPVGFGGLEFGEESVESADELAMLLGSNRQSVLIDFRRRHLGIVAHFLFLVLLHGLPLLAAQSHLGLRDDRAHRLLADFGSGTHSEHLIALELIQAVQRELALRMVAARPARLYKACPSPRHPRHWRDSIIPLIIFIFFFFLEWTFSLPLLHDSYVSSTRGISWTWANLCSSVMFLHAHAFGIYETKVKSSQPSVRETPGQAAVG